MSDAYALFRSLDPATLAGGGFAAVPFPDQPAHRVAVGAAGDPVILIATRTEAGSEVVSVF